MPKWLHYVNFTVTFFTFHLHKVITIITFLAILFSYSHLKLLVSYWNTNKIYCTSNYKPMINVIAHIRSKVITLCEFSHFFTVHLHKRGYVPGEPVFICAEIDNKSKKLMNGTSAKIIQVISSKQLNVITFNTYYN